MNMYVRKCTSRQVLNIIIYGYGHTLRAEKFNRGMRGIVYSQP